VERTADWSAALAAFERLFDAAIEAEATETAADALRGLARIKHRGKCFEEAEELADLSLEIAARNGHAWGAARAMNTLAVIHFLQHELEKAGDLYHAALQTATDCGDDALVGWSCQNLGVLANLRGDLREARSLYLESIASSVRSGDATTAMTAYNSLGLICADLQEWTESSLYFDRGLELAEQVGDVAVRTKLLANRAEPLIFVGEIDRAVSTLREAEELALEIDDPLTLAEVHRFRGLVCRLQHRLEEAEEHLARALELATESGLERGEVLEEMARLRWQQARPGAARATAREALHTYQALGANHDLARVHRLLAEWAPAPAG
jgi:tetratricopeptide (TPR) repeat protein